MNPNHSSYKGGGGGGGTCAFADVCSRRVRVWPTGLYWLVLAGGDGGGGGAKSASTGGSGSGGGGGSHKSGGGGKCFGAVRCTDRLTARCIGVM